MNNECFQRQWRFRIFKFRIFGFSNFGFRFPIFELQRYFSFFSQIRKVNLSKNFLVSNDVSSLFTNILLHETVYIAINLIFNHNLNLNITRKELKKLFLFATSQTHFIFNSKFYNQIDGVAMGSPLAPVLANIFMGFHESKWLNEYNLNKPKF